MYQGQTYDQGRQPNGDSSEYYGTDTASRLAAPLLTPEPTPISEKDRLRQKQIHRRRGLLRENTVLDPSDYYESELQPSWNTGVIDVSPDESEKKLRLPKRSYWQRVNSQPTWIWLLVFVIAIPILLTIFYTLRPRSKLDAFRRDQAAEIVPPTATFAKEAAPQHAAQPMFMPRKMHVPPHDASEEKVIGVKKTDGKEAEKNVKEEEVTVEPTEEAQEAPGMSPHHMLTACKQGDAVIVKAILNSHKGNRQLLSDDKFWTTDTENVAGDRPMHAAARFGNLEIVKLLFEEYQVPLNHRNLHHDFAIHVAAFEGHWPVVEYMISKEPATGALLEARGFCNQTPLQRAAANGKLAMVQLLVKKGAKLNARSMCTDTPTPRGAKRGDLAIHLASQWGHVDVVSFLLGANRDLQIDARNNFGRTPLLEAAHHGHLDVVELLVSRGANVYSKDNAKGATALHLAASAGNLDIVDFLTNVKPDMVDIRDTSLLTPLMTATSVGSLRVVQHLILKKGANVMAEDHDGLKMIHIAIKSGNVNLVSYLLEMNSNLIDARTAAGDMGLHLAAGGGQLEIVAIILSTKRALLEERGFGGMTPFLSAVAHGQTAMARYLASSFSADVSARCDDDGPFAGATAFHLASRFGHRRIIPYLFDLKPELATTKDAIGDLPVHVAAKYEENAQVISELISNKRADIESLGNSEMTPLLAATTENRVATVEYLLLNGANVNAWGMAGDKRVMAIHIAATLGHVEILNSLLRTQPDLISAPISNKDTAIHLAATAGQTQIVATLLDIKPELLESTGFIGRTALQHAAAAGKIETVQFLIKRVADLYARDLEFHSTAIHLAARFGHLDVVKALLEADPELLHVKNKINDQPLHRAVFGGKLDVMQYLIEEKLAEIDAKGEMGRSPLLLACTRGPVEVVEYLLDMGANPLASDVESGVNALQLAVYFNQEAIVERLGDRAPGLLEIVDQHGHTAIQLAQQRKLPNIVSILEAKIEQKNSMP